MKNNKSQAFCLAFYIIFPNQPELYRVGLRFGGVCAIIREICNLNRWMTK